MTASFRRLTDAVPPPLRPIEPGTLAAFAPVEAGLDLILPDDYKQLVCAYGIGSWLDFLWVLSPFASNPHLNVTEQAGRQLGAERVIRADWPTKIPFAIFPEPGGLFPWGLTDNGNRLYWQTEGAPDSWPIIVYESRGPRYDRHELRCCEFLRRWVAGDLHVAVFPGDCEYGGAPAFKPIKDA